MEFVVLWATAVLSPPVLKGCAFRQDVSAAVFDDCWLVLLGLGETPEGVVVLSAGS